MNPSERMRRGRWRKRSVLVVALAMLAGGAAAADRAPALSPEDALRAFRVEEGLRVELVAAEPLIVSPVAFAFDERGRLFVVESRGYPGPVAEGQDSAAVAGIALLEDRDGDGRYDKRTEFASGLTFPNGILPWGGGVFVTCAPDVLFFKDTNGDGVADEKRVVLTGFNANKTPQIRTSHPTLGLDGRIYLTSGLNGGKVRVPERPERAEVAFAAADSRFDPRTLEFEMTGGRGQFGLTFDAYGRRFNVSNRHPVMHVALEPWHLRRNPHLAFADTAQHVSKVEAEATVWPISRASVTADFIPSLMSKPHTGTFTSACGTLVFGGSALGAEHTGNVFICEPAQNLVQRQTLRREGASFRSDVARPGREFLASTDVWFRPVFLGEGPDGALYVADMNRREIDHPAYVPEESRGKLDFESGKARGRIYRITRSAYKPAVLGNTGAELARELESPDGWRRERAQRLLVERGGAGVESEIERVAREGGRPEGRTRALWTLRGFGRLRAEMVVAALRDADPGVREQAVQLGWEMAGSHPEMATRIAALADDADARVRFQVALAIGSWSDERAVIPLAAIASKDGQDRWARAAVLSGVGGRMDAFRVAFARLGGPAAPAVMEDLGRMIGAGAPVAAAGEFLREALRSASWGAPAVLGLAEGLRGRAEFKGKAPGAALATLAGEDAARLDAFFKQAAELALDGQAALARRTGAIALLGLAEYAGGVGRLGPLLDARQPPELQLQTIRALDRAGDARGAELLTKPEYWGRYTPQVREAAVAALVSKPVMLKALFAAIRRGDIKAPEISSVRRAQLQKHANAELREEAIALFRPLEGGDRMAAYRALRDVIAAPADAARGEPVFTRACASCHTYKGVGGKVGPDLTGVRNQPADALLLHILVPNYEVAPSYQTVTVATRDGRSVSGWLAAETEASLQLRTAEGTEETILRRDVASLSASGLSLMPDGLEQAMTREELANLVAFLKRDD